MTTTDNSSVTVTPSETTITGADGMLFFKAITLKSALSLWMKTKMIPTRGVTITVMLALATEITKKPYRRGQPQLAHNDLSTWIETMRAALPRTVNGVQQ